MGRTALAVVDIDYMDPVQLAVVGYLSRYREPTRTGNASNLRQWFQWCANHKLHLFKVKRVHIELYARAEEEKGLKPATVKKKLSTIAGFYRFAHIDGYMRSNPAEYVQRPKVDGESTTLGLDRMEMGAFLANAQAGSLMDHALACLLAIMGLRISEACGIQIGDLGDSRGHRTINIMGKGQKFAVMPMPPRVFRTIDMAIEGRHEGPVLLNQYGLPMNRYNASRIVTRLCKAAGIHKRITPHSLRHSAITAALDAGTPLRDVQIFARHADPRTTTRYDRARNNLDRSATYIIAAFVAGGA